jgi:hypothetical protein
MENNLATRHFDFWTLTPALAPGASVNAENADSNRFCPGFFKSASLCVFLHPILKTVGRLENNPAIVWLYRF